VTDENAENGATTRLTRAKAAALDNASVGDPPKKALATKRSTTTTTTTTGTLGARKRTALGDVSNVTKKEPTETADAKKDSLAKATLSKAAKPAGIQKQPSRTTSTRTALGQKASNNTSSELKRPASGSGIQTGPASKKRNTSTTKPKRPVVEEEEEDNDDEDAENVPPPKNGANIEVEKKSKVKTILQESGDLDDDEQHKSLEELIKEAKDLDTEDLDDPLMVAEYVHEIFEYMHELEISTMPSPDYMDNQGELEWKMRGILVDWLLEVHARFRLLPETLFLAVNIIDRFLSCKVVQLDRLQLVGVTAMFIASKYEEVLSPHVQNFVHVADDGFKDTEILSAERFVLATLDYDLSYPNPMNFLRRISKADNYDIQTRTLGKYLLEIGCLDHRFLKYPPSQVAAAAMYLARLALDRGEWDATLSKYAGYTEPEIQPVFKLMVDYLSSPVVHEAFFRKYASKKFLKGQLIAIARCLPLIVTDTDFSFHRSPPMGQEVGSYIPRRPKQWQDPPLIASRSSLSNASARCAHDGENEPASLTRLHSKRALLSSIRVKRCIHGTMRFFHLFYFLAVRRW
jgi:G2/mitotic-specific cyclin 1/2